MSKNNKNNGYEAIMEMLKAMDEKSEARFNALEKRIEAIEGTKKTSSTKKTTATKTTKATKTSTKSSDGFDRALYEATAKKLGVYNTQYGKVVATVVNGKVVSTQSENRKKVYAAMGYSK